MSMPLIIDDRGTVWPADSLDLIKRHGEAGREVDALVNDLGFLRIDTFRSSQMVTFRPGRTAPASVIGAFYTVMEFRPQRIVLKFFVADPANDQATEPRGWRQEIHGDIDLALRRIEDLVKQPE